MRDREYKEKAVQLLSIEAERLFDRYNNPVVYSAKFNESLKQIAKRFELSEDYLWQRYVGVNPEEIKETKKSSIEKHKKQVNQRLKLIELKTPRSSWWLAKKKKNASRLGYRLVRVPDSRFVYVRVPTYVDRYHWLQKLGWPVKLLKSIYRQGALEKAIDIIRKPSKFPAVIGNFWENREDKELERKYKKQIRLQEVMDEIRAHRVELMLDKVGDRVGFDRVVVLKNVFTGKDYLEEKWLCREGNFCPCGRHKSCSILNEVKKITSYRREDGKDRRGSISSKV